MRNPSLHAALHDYVDEAAGYLSARTAAGEEVPFEVAEQGEPGGAWGLGSGRPPLYCYRPLTGAFIDERRDALAGLPAYAPAARALESLDGLEAYLRARGRSRVPDQRRARADEALAALLRRVFAGSGGFELAPARFERAYGELESHVYQGRTVVTVLAPVLEIDLDPDEVDLGDGLSLMRGDAFDDPPSEAVWGLAADRAEPATLVVFRHESEHGAASAVTAARTRFRRLITALRLFEAGGAALGPVAWARADAGSWRAVPLGATGRPAAVVRLTAPHAADLRAFCDLVSRRAPRGGEVAWALARFEMGCERRAPLDALTDHLLALRALLEPEGPASGRLGQRLAALCGRPEERPALAARVAEACALERSAVTGLAPARSDAEALVAEVAGHARAILSDVLCGHLEPDLWALADDLLAGAPPATVEL